MAVMAAQRMPGAVAAFAAVAVLASAVGGGWAADADRALFEHVRARRGKTGTVIARRICALAEPAVVYPVLAVAGAGAACRAGWRHGWEPCLVVASGAVARRRLSQVIARPRPPEQAWRAEPEGFSLPSRHTTLAALAAGACVRAAGIRGTPARAAPLLAAAGVGASRVYLGVHWPADVIAGWLFAEGWLRLTGPC
jgi:membrane-associated phospholipid phosphatase